jgi:hypothetical protein
MSPCAKGHGAVRSWHWAFVAFLGGSSCTALADFSGRVVKLSEHERAFDARGT